MAKLNPEQRRQQLQSLIDQSFWLDHRFRIPFTRVGIGWDPLIGLIPFVGGFVTFVMSARIILGARRLEIGNRRLVRMMSHACLDAVIGMIPFAGAIMDVFYRANLMNLRILLDHLAETSAGGSKI